MKKPNEETKEAENDIDVMSFEVSGVRQFEKTVFFNLKLNGVQIYGCTVVEGKKGDFISLPSRKGKGEKWYSIVYARISEHDQEIILAEVEKQLNK